MTEACPIEKAYPGQLYAGIGSRKTPPGYQAIMAALGRSLAHQGLTLRSGGAIGADQAFERGCDSIHGSKKEIFKAEDATGRARLIARQFHPLFDHLPQYAKNLHGRNVMIILGKNLDTPVDFVIAWTPGAQWQGKEAGGTGMALRIAYHFKIRVWNLAFEVHYNRVVGLYL